jgi:hypothetical protein
MTLWLKRAVFSAAIWTTVTVIFLFTAFAGDGPAGLEEGASRRNLIAGCLAAGIVGHLLLTYRTRERRDGDSVLVDERDRELVRKGSQFAFAATAIGVFLGCIALDDAYQTTGCVPVGWVWFVGYGGWILSYLSPAIATIILYARAGARGEG